MENGGGNMLTAELARAGEKKESINNRVSD